MSAFPPFAIAPLYWSVEGDAVRHWSGEIDWPTALAERSPSVEEFADALGLPPMVAHAHAAAAGGVGARFEVPWRDGVLTVHVTPQGDGASRAVAQFCPTCAFLQPCRLDVAGGVVASADLYAERLFDRPHLVGTPLADLLDAEARPAVDRLLAWRGGGALTVRHHTARDSGGLAELFVEPQSGAGEARRLTFTPLAQHPDVRRELIRLASYAQQHPHPMVETTRDGRIRYANDAALRDLPDLERRGADHPFMSELHAATLPGGEQIARTVLLPDGRCFEQQLGRAPSGGVRIYATDVTQAARTAAALRSQVAEVERLRALAETERDFAETLIDTLGEPVAIIDTKGRVRFANQVAEQMVGLTREALRRVSIFDLVHPDDQALLRTRFRGRAERGRERYEIRIRTAHDGYRQGLLTAAPLLLPDGSMAGSLATFTDLTEETRARQHIETLRHFYESVLAELPIEVSVLDAAGRYLFANPQAVRDPFRRGAMLGQRPSELASHSPGEAQQLRARQIWIDTILAEKLPSSVVERRQEGGGRSERLVEQTATPLLGETGEVTFVVVYGLDIGERVAHERALVAARRSAEEMNTLKTTFVANVTHEIRTPLTAIIGFADYLNDELPGDMDREPLELIRSSGMRLLHTLSDVIDSARMASGTFSIDLYTLDVQPLVREQCDLFRPEADASGLFLTCRVDRRPAPARINADALRRIVSSLLSNAIRFTPKGGIEVEVRAADDEVLISVSDTGVGIDPQFEAYVFEAFRQGTIGSARTQQGSGLGLPIAKGLAESMGGTIRFRSRLGSGSTFVVHLPLAS
jgi:PAS domain S-box-containing protein